jgi:hypothetical protein
VQVALVSSAKVKLLQLYPEQGIQFSARKHTCGSIWAVQRLCGGILAYVGSFKCEIAGQQRWYCPT